MIAAVGGGEEFRAAIATGTAPCLNLTESARTWVVVNKTMSLAPVDYAPAPLAKAEGVRDAGGGHLRADAAAALTQLAAAASAEGAGTLALNSGYRPYTMQVSTYDGYVRSLGADGADLTSARPGYSEHQTGLAADVVACSGSCGGLETFAGTAQARLGCRELLALRIRRPIRRRADGDDRLRVGAVASAVTSAPTWRPRITTAVFTASKPSSLCPRPPITSISPTPQIAVLSFA